MLVVHLSSPLLVTQREGEGEGEGTGADEGEREGESDGGGGDEGEGGRECVRKRDGERGSEGEFKG